MSNPIFNKPTDRYIFHGTELRGLSGEKLRLSYRDTNIDITDGSVSIDTLNITGGIMGTLRPIGNSTQIFTTLNTYVYTPWNDPNFFGGNTPNVFEDVTNFESSISLVGGRSSVKYEFRVNYISSYEAEQTLSFQLQYRTSGNANFTTLYTDVSLGAAMGVGIKNVWIGSGVFSIVGVPSDNTRTVYIKLRMMKNVPTYDQTIDTSYGIINNPNSNYILLQELYRPS